MSESGADVSWDDVRKVLEEEKSSAEDIQADLVRNNKGNICQSIDNCMTVFQRDPLLKGAIRKNELSGKIDIVGDLGWERTSSSLTDTDVYQLHWYLEKQYGLDEQQARMIFDLRFRFMFGTARDLVERDNMVIGRMLEIFLKDEGGAEG